jgi:hypothetical protein
MQRQTNDFFSRCIRKHTYYYWKKWEAWISRNKLKSKLRLKSEILLKFEKTQKNAFLEKNLAQILTQLEKKLKSP